MFLNVSLWSQSDTNFVVNDSSQTALQKTSDSTAINGLSFEGELKASLSDSQNVNSTLISLSTLEYCTENQTKSLYYFENLLRTEIFSNSPSKSSFFTSLHSGTYRLKFDTYDKSDTSRIRNDISLKVNVNTSLSNFSLTLIGLGILLLIVLIVVLYKLGSSGKTESVTERIKSEERIKLQKQIENFHFLGLTSIFSINDLDSIKENQTEIYSILSYFATSLFDKEKLEEVLWDITKNCISKLDLEDCVIYWIEDKTTLVQKSAHGNKEIETGTILNPIDIPMGKGIVGSVAQSGKPELIADLTKDDRYIIDNGARLSELAVPIFLNDQVVGVIDSEHSIKGYFTPGHLKIFLLVAKLLEKKLSQISDKNSISLTNDNVYFKQLNDVMDKQKLYRDPLLGLVSVAEELNISSGYLSRLINTLTGSNFNNYINTYRVNEVKKNLRNTEFDNYSILAIGLESGFNSKSVFYAAFKKHTGISPSEYKNLNS